MSQLKQKNPQAYSFINNAMKTGSDPAVLANKVLKDNNITGAKLEEFKQHLKHFGVPDDILNKLG